MSTSGLHQPRAHPRWFLPVSGELRPAGRFQLEGNASGKIERCDPPGGFAATWEFGGSMSWIELRLTAVAPEQTRLEHLVPVDDHWIQFSPGAVGLGWDLAPRGLALHLPAGTPADPEQAARWMASEEGKQFLSASGERWCDANIAAGADEAPASAAAARTIAAYTGTPG